MLCEPHPYILAATIPTTLYRGSWWKGEGLWRSADDGETWEQVDGIATDASIYAMASGHDEQRLVVYVSVTGGFVTPAEGMQSSANFSALGSGNPVKAGVYRLTLILPTGRVYLPLVVR